MAVRITRSKSSEKIGVGVPNGSPSGSGFPVRQESNRRTETAHMATNPPSPPTAPGRLRTAAALLLGLGVAISVWWLRDAREDERGEGGAA